VFLLVWKWSLWWRKQTGGQNLYRVDCLYKTLIWVPERPVHVVIGHIWTVWVFTCMLWFCFSRFSWIRVIDELIADLVLVGGIIYQPLSIRLLFYNIYVTELSSVVLGLNLMPKLIDGWSYQPIIWLIVMVSNDLPHTFYFMKFLVQYCLVLCSVALRVVYVCLHFVVK